MTTNAGVTQVIFDPMRRRFKGQVVLPAASGRQILTVSAPGHPSWDHRRIQSALIASAQGKARREVAHART